jgi:hypothetical protein
LTSATDEPELEAIVKFWGHAYTFSHDPRHFPDEPYAAHRKDGTGTTLRTATLAGLLDAVKDDAASRHPLTTREAP